MQDIHHFCEASVEIEVILSIFALMSIHIYTKFGMAQSARAIEYTDCTSADG